jgi:hypothetical protein
VKILEDVSVEKMSLRATHFWLEQIILGVASCCRDTSVWYRYADVVDCVMSVRLE